MQKGMRGMQCCPLLVCIAAGCSPVKKKYNIVNYSKHKVSILMKNYYFLIYILFNSIEFKYIYILINLLFSINSCIYFLSILSNKNRIKNKHLK